MNSDTFWLALALVFVLEGLFPFASPVRWRNMFSQLLQMSDGQIRFFALLSIGSGLALIYFFSG